MNTRQNKKTLGWLENRKNAQVAALIMSAVSAAPALAQITIAQAEQEANNTPNTTIDTSTITDVISQGGGFVSDGYTYTNWSFLATDGTGSLDIFGKMPTGSTYTPTVGDEIQATGTYYPFRNTPELETLTSITDKMTTGSIPSPTVVTIPQMLQLANTGTSTNSNAIQGYLLQLNDVTFTGLEDNSSGNTPESVMTQHANNQWTATDSSGNSILMYQYASSYSVSGALALQNGGAIPTTAQDVIGLAQVYNGTAEFIPLSYSNSTNVAPPPPANSTILTPSALAQQTQGSSSTAGILSVSVTGSGTSAIKTVTANVGTWVNVGTASNPSYEFATLPNESVTTPLALGSSGGNSGDATYYAGVANGAHAFPGTNYPIPTGTTGTANIGFSASDTGGQAGSALSGSVQITNSDNLSDSPVNVSINANSPLHVLAQRDLSAGASTSGSYLGNVLVGATSTINNVPLYTTNATAAGFSSTYLTNVTLLANSTSESYTQKDPFTGNTVATFDATTPNYDQVFGGPNQGQTTGAFNNAGTETTPIPGDNALPGTVSVTITPAISGWYGNGQSQTVGGVTETYNANYASFEGTAEGVVGMGLPFENESVYVYAQFIGFQPAAVTVSGSVSSGVTLTNAPTNDAIITEGSSSANFGLRASAWVTSASANQDGWSQSGLTPATAGTGGAQDSPGTVVPGSGGVGDTSSHSTSGITFSYNPAAALAGSYSGGTYSIGLENAEYDDQGAIDGGAIAGATHNDLAPVTLPLPNETGTGNGSGTYNFGGGTFTASGPTNLTGSFTQTGGTANFQQITGGGAVTLSGGLLKIAASAPNISTLGSLAISGTGTLDITNNEITVPDTTGSAAALVADLKAGFDGGKWDGTGIISSTAAATRGTSIGYVDNGSVTTIRYTWLGDLDLSGTITGADVTAMTNGNGTSWSQGDLNYDGVKNADDWSLFELGAEMAGSKMLPAPEPGAFTLLAIPAIAAMRRRRR